MYRASIASRGKNAAGLLRTMTTSYFRQVFKRLLMLAMTAISSLFHVYGGRYPLATHFTVYITAAVSATLYITSDEGELLHPVVVQTSVNTTARLLMLKTKMTQVGVTSLLLILGIFCSAEWARVEGLLCFTHVVSFSSFLLLSLFRRLFSPVADWMFTIHPHMMRP